MCPLGQEDTTATGVDSVPTIELLRNDSLCRQDLGRRQAPSSKLSCISEHQKENSRSCEDGSSASISQALETLLLEPTRSSHFRRQATANIQSSGDSSPISPFQLDFEQVEECSQGGREQNRPSDNVSEALCSASAEIFNGERQGIRWADTESSKMHVKRHRSTCSGTGFDGPLSSVNGTPPLRLPTDASSGTLGSSLLSNDLTGGSRKLRSDTSGSIDWEKSWPKRKPRRIHNVSESSNPDPPANLRSINSSSMVRENQNGGDKSNTDALRRNEQGKSNSQLHTIQKCALKSCPDLHQQSLPVATPTVARFSVDKDCGIKPPNYSRFDNSRHQHHFRMPSTISKRFRILREKLHRSRSSSTYSIRSEFPAPPDGKERRFLSRNSTDIWPSSGEESPIFNTPESNITPPQSGGRNLDPLAASGLMIATAELDRLSSSHNQGSRSGVSASSFSQASVLSDATSPQNESDPLPSDIVPSGLVSSPKSPPPLSDLAGPTFRLSQWQGQRRRGQRSRLSEVTTPEELGSPGEATNDAGLILPQLLSSSIEPLREILGCFDVERSESMVPQPLLINRPASSDLNSPASVLEAEPGTSPPAGTSSMRHTPESMYEQPNSDDQSSPWRSTQEDGPSSVQPSAISRDLGSESCHLDTWTEGQGEPGDSDPFCPPSCLDARRDSGASRGPSRPTKGGAGSTMKMINHRDTSKPGQP
ncbi:hypothetical protein F5Y19DRAFT_477716 [Xylariaceae sp. FL1651]|nr:hypothetical protein F5Y19DRAFT_477716 [Xylariaceae sp. FL1651]